MQLRKKLEKKFRSSTGFSIAPVSNPVEVLNFLFRLLLRNCVNCVNNCERTILHLTNIIDGLYQTIEK